MDDERRKKIFAPVIKVGGITKPLKNKAPVSTGCSSAISALKNDLAPTILKTFTYREGNNIYNYDKAVIKSITKGKKHVCFLVSGEPQIMSQEEALESMPDYISDTLKNFKKEDSAENVD